MAISFIDFANNDVAPGTAVTVNKPTGTANGDVMLAQFSCYDNPGTITVPDVGWQLIRSDAQTTHPATMCALYYKVASSEGADYAWSWASSKYVQISIATYRGVDNGSPVNVSGGQGNSGTVSVTAPSVTPSAGTKMLLYYGTIRSNRTFTMPSGFTAERYDSDVVAGDASDNTHTLADLSITGGSPTGSKVGTATGSTSFSSSIGQLVALNEAGGGGGSGARSFAVVVA